MRTSLIVFGILAVVMIGFATWNYLPQVSNPPKASSPEQKPISPVQIKMNMLQIPKLNDLVTLEFEVISKLPHRNPVQVDLMLPEGFKFVEGDLVLTSNTIIEQDTKEGLRWFGNLSANEAIKLSAKVRAVKSGEYWLIGASAGAPEAGGLFTGADVLFVSFNETFGEVLTEEDLYERGLFYDTASQRVVNWTGPEATAERIG